MCDAAVVGAAIAGALAVRAVTAVQVERIRGERAQVAEAGVGQRTGSITSAHTRSSQGLPGTPQAGRHHVVQELRPLGLQRHTGPPEGVALGADEEARAVRPEAVRVQPVLLAAGADRASRHGGQRVCGVVSGAVRMRA
ncbi:hypothetical protein ACWDZ8_23290 [Streptomyces sp. NPDC003233]